MIKSVYFVRLNLISSDGTSHYLSNSCSGHFIDLTPCYMCMISIGSNLINILNVQNLQFTLNPLIVL